MTDKARSMWAAVYSELSAAKPGLLGAIIARAERDQGRGGDRRSRSQAATVKLKDFGINKTQSSRWQKLAALDPDVFETKVETASKRAYDNLTRRFIKEEEIKRAKEQHAKIIEHGCVDDDLVALAASGKRFGVIYCDPPWPFEVYWEDGHQRSAECHYDTLSIAEIKALPVQALAADDCALILWGTWPDLPGVLDVIKAWGFEYKSNAFVWVKLNRSGEGFFTGMGFGTRSNTEYALLATRGDPLRLNADVHQIIEAPVSQHSEKPEECFSLDRIWNCTVPCRLGCSRLRAGPYLVAPHGPARHRLAAWISRAPLGCWLRQACAGTDDEGFPITSCLVFPASAGTTAGIKRLTDNQARFVAILREAIIEVAVPTNETEGRKGLPSGVRTVARDMLKRYCIQGGWLEDRRHQGLHLDRRIRTVAQGAQAPPQAPACAARCEQAQARRYLQVCL
jgi:N6-adenosine-specific RNA methylase IME4